MFIPCILQDPTPGRVGGMMEVYLNEDSKSIYDLW